MTRLTYIHAIPTEENAQRAQNVGSGAYVPYLSLTQGEMRLMLAQQRAKVYAQFYPDVPQFRKAETMLDNALNAGVSGGVQFVGYIADELQDVAALIKTASRQTRPAARTGIYGRSSLLRGIGKDVVPAAQRMQECSLRVVKSGKDVIRRLAECKRQFEIERIFNGAIVNTGHHVLYHKINQSWQMPQRVFSKLLLHLAGTQAMAVAGDLQKPLMAEWVETGIIERNAQGAAGPIGSLKSSFLLSPDPALVEQYYQHPTDPMKDKLNKMNSGAGVQGIGLVPAAAAIISAIAGALVGAAALINALRQQQATVAAQGFGTEAYSGQPSDWQGEFSGQGISPLLLIGGAAAVWFLMDDDKKGKKR